MIETISPIGTYYEGGAFSEEARRDVGVPDLAYEVASILQKPQDDELYLLPDTGFLVKDQIRLFYENLENGVSLEDSMQQVEQDVQGFKTEYLVQQPVFPIVLEKAVYEGRLRLVGALYGGKPIAETTSEVERGGAVRESIEKIEQHLLTAEPGSLVVMTSPRGWSGYQNKNGELEALNSEDIKTGLAKEIVYPDSQTYCFQVQENGDIRGFTLKSDMDIYQNEKLLQTLGVSKDNFTNDSSHSERIKQAVSNVVYLEPDSGVTIESVVDLVEEIKGKKTAYVDTDNNSRTFDEMRGLLANPESLWTLDDTTRNLIDRFKKYAAWGIINNNVDRKNLEIALGTTVLRLMHEINQPKSENRLEIGAEEFFVEDAVGFFNPREALREMQEIPGCAGGGTIDSITPRDAKIKDGETKILCCTCPYCKEKVEAEIAGGKIKCPSCGETVKWTD